MPAKFRIIVFLLFISTVSVAAQESNIYREMLKESLGKDFIKRNITLEPDSNLYRKLLQEEITTLPPDLKLDSVLYRRLLLYRIKNLIYNSGMGEIPHL